MKIFVQNFWYFQDKNNFKRRYHLFAKVPSFSNKAHFHVDIQAVTLRGCLVLLVSALFCAWGSIFWLGRVTFALLSSSPFKQHMLCTLNTSIAPGCLLAAETRRVISAQEFAWDVTRDRLDLHMQDFRLKSILNTPFNCLSTSGL